MAAEVKLQGQYELFETTHQHRILVLDNERWFAWVEGDEGDILVHSDSDHRKDHTLQKGKFYFVEFEDDEEFVDQPHLFLQQGGKYQELLLPNGFPTERDHQKKLVAGGETVAGEKLERHLGKA